VSLPSLYACRQRKITASSSSSSGCRQSLASESKALSCFLGWESLGSASNWIGFPSLLPSSSLPCHHHQAVTSIGLIDSFITSRICKALKEGDVPAAGDPHLRLPPPSLISSSSGASTQSLTNSRMMMTQDPHGPHALPFHWLVSFSHLDAF
jgi:hypothetical protein